MTPSGSQKLLLSNEALLKFQYGCCSHDGHNDEHPWIGGRPNECNVSPLISG